MKILNEKRREFWLWTDVSNNFNCNVFEAKSSTVLLTSEKTPKSLFFVEILQVQKHLLFLHGGRFMCLGVSGYFNAHTQLHVENEL